MLGDVLQKLPGFGARRSDVVELLRPVEPPTEPPKDPKRWGPSGPAAGPHGQVGAYEGPEIGHEHHAGGTRHCRKSRILLGPGAPAVSQVLWFRECGCTGMEIEAQLGHHTT